MEANAKKEKLIKIFGIMCLVSIVLFIISWFIPSSGDILVLMPLFPISLLTALVSGSTCYYLSTGQWDHYFKGLSQKDYNTRYLTQSVRTHVWRRDYTAPEKCAINIIINANRI